MYFMCTDVSSKYVLFLDCFGYSGSLGFPYEFEVQFVNFCKKALGVRIGIVLNL